MTALALVAGALCTAVEASDHADAPEKASVVRQDANLTDLHAFTAGNNLVIALSSNPSIPESAASYVFPADVVFEINIDNHSAVIADDPLAMGGTIAEPDKIRQDITFRISFGKDGAPRVQTFLRGEPRAALQVAEFFAGLRDDPFIRGPRQGRNVAAIVLAVPLSAVVNGQSTLLIWATSKVDGFGRSAGDLVGRALRSMMPENAGMNELRPRRHEVLMGVPPDVMIFDTARPAAFPNGRALSDDVVDLVNDARVLATDAPYPSTNDLPFLSTFPYLAPPHPPR